MATVILIRHARSTANASGVLAGRTEGVELDELGHEQARATAQRLAGVPIVTLVSSPMLRCQQTAAAIAGQQSANPTLVTDEDLNESDYGRWQGRKLSDLSGEDLWQVVQRQPSAVVFPGGESLAGMQARAVAAIRRRDALIEAEHGAGAVWAAVSHGDLIGSILADALGMHLDLYQRIMVHPASTSVIRYTAHRPEVLTVNGGTSDLSWLAAQQPANQVGGADAEHATTPEPS